MKKSLAVVLLLLAMAYSPSANAARGGMEAMMGRWIWNGFVVEVSPCKATGICAKVISGPKNIGMQMIQSPPIPKGREMYGKVKHPLSGEVYNVKMSFSPTGDWQMDGCPEKENCPASKFMNSR